MGGSRLRYISLAVLGATIAIAAGAAATSVADPSPTDEVPFEVPEIAEDHRTSPLGLDEGRLAILEGSSVGVHERGSDGEWTRTATLTPPDEAGTRFGVSIAVEGDTIVVGDPSAVDSEGRVFVYAHADGDWQLADRWSADGDSTLFGFNVEADGDRVVAHAPGDDSPVDAGSENAHSRAYVWRQDAGGWVQEAKVGVPTENRQIAFDEGTLVAVTRSSAPVFEKSPDGWAKTAELPEPPNGLWRLIDIELEGATLALSYDSCGLCGGGLDVDFAFYHREASDTWRVEDHRGPTTAISVGLEEGMAIRGPGPAEVHHRVPVGAWPVTGTMTSPPMTVAGDHVAFEDGNAVLTDTFEDRAYLYDTTEITTDLVPAP